MRHIELLLVNASSVWTHRQLLLQAVTIHKVLVAHMVIDLVLELVLLLDVGAQVHALRNQTVTPQL